MTVAYTINGEPIAYPANVIALRAKRMKAKGAPELLYKDGVPLVFAPDGDLAADVLEQVGDQFEDGEPVRIKLDPIDERGRIVDDVPAAFLQFNAPRAGRVSDRADRTEAADASISTDLSIVREAMRLNAAMAQTAIAKLPAIMEAAAHILSAADGAGMPARTPIATPEGARNAAPETPATPADERPRNATAEMLHEISGMLKNAQPYAQIAYSMFGAKRGPRNAAPSTPEPTFAETSGTHQAPPSSPDAPGAPSPAPTPMDAASLAVHMEAVKALLTAEERAIAQAAVGEMSPEQVQDWISKLSALSVEAAAAEIRAKIGGVS